MQYLFSYSDKMLESADTPLSMSVPIQSLENNLSAADCLVPLNNALSTHTLQLPITMTSFQTVITIAYKN